MPSMTAQIRETRVGANGMEFACLEAGDGPLVLLLHGFPDTAHTWRHLIPSLAEAGWRAVAPFMRGYSPTTIPSDGSYHTGSLASDACALHEALGGDSDAVLIGHDWGALAAYGAAVAEPGRWRRVVTMAVPPSPAMARAFFDYDQLRRSFYIFFFQTPLADAVVRADGFRFIRRLWEDWSPGYDAREDLVHVIDSIGSEQNLAAALGYYRALFDEAQPPGDVSRFQAATAGVPTQPLLYLHGTADGCVGVELTEGLENYLAEGSSVVRLEKAGHFLHLERPEHVSELVLTHLG
ncbi:MAG: epoxide hydrolase [Acidimicrobiales bacterium]|nr:MAG: epoxide hydrolase [Acidimicrobiales bacterium]